MHKTRDLILDSTFSYNSTCTPVAGSGECGIGFNPVGCGGGIYNDSSATELDIEQSTFWGNLALTGGAICNEESTLWNPTPPAGLPFSGAVPCQGVCLNNNTIASNTAFMGGGGIWNNPGLAFINEFVSNLIASNVDHGGNFAPDIQSAPANNTNTAPGIYQGPAPSPFSPPSVSPPAPVYEGFNLVGDCGLGVGGTTLITANCGLTNDKNWDIVGGSVIKGQNIDPRLHDLSKNGGPTETIALFPDSPAVNNGFNNLSLAYDQRGNPFFRVVAQCDIGSYEYQYD